MGTQAERVAYPAKIRLLPAMPEDPQVGDAWYDNRYLESAYADRYKGRNLRPLAVQVSDIHHFMVYARQSRPPHIGWVVSGSVEGGNLTVSPSININAGSPDNFHGYIRGGYVILA